MQCNVKDICAPAFPRGKPKYPPEGGDLTRWNDRGGTLKAHVVDKRKLRRRQVTEDPARAPAGAFCTIAVAGGIAMVDEVLKAPARSRAVVAGPVAPALRNRCGGAELTRPGTRWKPHPTDHRSGAIWDYVQTAGAGKDGASTHPGFAGEMHLHADL